MFLEIFLKYRVKFRWKLLKNTNIQNMTLSSTPNQNVAKNRRAVQFRKKIRKTNTYFGSGGNYHRLVKNRAYNIVKLASKPMYNSL